MGIYQEKENPVMVSPAFLKRETIYQENHRHGERS